MPRRPRLVLPDIPLHIIQRGNNRNSCFFCDSDYLVYLAMLRDSAHFTKCRIHAYILMTNHVHLLITPPAIDSPAKMMKSLGERYVRYVNDRHVRVGTLWQGRYRSCLVQDEGYLLTCHRYIELNAVRAGMVSHPAEYRWSSHRGNAYGETDSLLTRHAIYNDLGRDDVVRRQRYQHLFTDSLDDRTIADVRQATNSNSAFGNPAFAKSISQQLGGTCGRLTSAMRGG